MKTHLFLRFFWIIFLLFSIISNQFGQQPLKVITYTTHFQYLFSIPFTEEGKNLNDLDYNKLIAKEKDIITEINIEADQFPSITQTFLNLPEYTTDYENGVYQTVANKMETTLYDHSQQVISRTPTDSDDPIFRRFSDAEIRFYGTYNQGFALSPAEIVQNFNLMGLNCRYFPNRYTIIALNSEMEIMIHLRDLIYEIRYFSNQGFEWSQTFYYQKWGDYIIPKMEVNMTKDTLSHQIPYVKTEIINYLNYSILNGEGKNIVDYSNKEWNHIAEKGIQIQPYEEINKRDFEIQIYPNPATTQITVEIPFYMQDQFKIEIFNNLGQLMYSQEGKNQSIMEVNISDFKEGFYLVQCKNTQMTSSTKFIKN
jgi:hypothetical protein